MIGYLALLLMFHIPDHPAMEQQTSDEKQLNSTNTRLIILDAVWMLSRV